MIFVKAWNTNHSESLRHYKMPTFDLNLTNKSKKQEGNLCMAADMTIKRESVKQVSVKSISVPYCQTVISNKNLRKELGKQVLC